MKKFVELIKRVHQERFSVVMNKIVAEKIPVAFLSIAPIEQAIELVKNLRAQDLNITNLITITPPPPVSDNFQVDFDITNLADADKIHPRPEYILVTDVMISARVANKYIPDCKVVSLGGPFLNSELGYEVFMNNLDKLQEVYESLIDEESKKTFCGYWLGNISHQLGEMIYSNGAHYVTSGFMPESGAIVIDGGAYDGSSAATFSEMDYKVYAFEMDKKNFESAKKIAKEKNFVLENLGLGSYEHEMSYVSMTSCSHVDAEGSDKAQITTLDNYVREKNLPRIDCIKLDVEGAELDVLKGAKISISRWKPILWLSAYHKWDDFWTLMNFVKSIRPDYEFAIRQYYITPEDELDYFARMSADLGQDFEKVLDSFGLEPYGKQFTECCLLAR